jgi:ABC-type multidrug transport system fused ATPase/permease subunit
MRFWKESKFDTFHKVIKILPKRDLNKVLMMTFLQVILGFLDLIGVVLTGFIATMSINGIRTSEPNVEVNKIFSYLNLAETSFQSQVLILGVVAVTCLIGKSLLSIYFTRRILYFLSRRGASISAELVSKLLSQSIVKIQEKSIQETVFSLTSGVQLIMINVIATTSVLLSDFSLLLVMGIALLYVDTWTALATILLFIFIGFYLHKTMHDQALKLGQASSEMNIESSERIVEALSSYREIFVGNRRLFYAEEIGKIRVGLSEVLAEISFMPFISKYVIEISTVVCAILMSIFQFGLNDSAKALSTLAIFLVAGSRIAPAFLRVQQSAVQIQGGIGSAGPTFSLIESLDDVPPVMSSADKVDLNHFGFSADVELMDVRFRYPGQNEWAIDNLNLTIPVGTIVAFVGPSGAGKTTIVDLILGILTPDSGSIAISGLKPLQTFHKWPGAVAYVPQEVVIADCSIRRNIALGYPQQEATNERILKALRLASLEGFTSNLPSGIDTEVGERGAKISGGERQRLGIARALFTDPALLVLDEATSSLDGVTEASINRAIQSLRGSVTVIMIAHRLSSVLNADKVVYMDNGKILAEGTFEEVREMIPNFDRQAKLMGL